MFRSSPLTAATLRTVPSTAFASIVRDDGLRELILPRAGAVLKHPLELSDDLEQLLSVADPLSKTDRRLSILERLPIAMCLINLRLDRLESGLNVVRQGFGCPIRPRSGDIRDPDGLLLA